MHVGVFGDGQPGLGGVVFLREPVDRDGAARAYIERLVRAFNEAHDVSERLGAWAIHPQPLRESDFVGPTAKLRRRRVEEAYAKLFA